MEPSDLVGHMAQLPFFSEWSKADLKRLSPIVHVREVTEGQLLHRIGEPARELAIVLGGRIGVEYDIPGRGVTTVGTVATHQLFGWSSVVPPYITTATTKALTPVTLLVIDGPGVMRLCEEMPSFGYRFSKRLVETLAGRLQLHLNQLLDMYRRPA
jgi:CRP-like cAMP-binding protein